MPILKGMSYTPDNMGSNFGHAARVPTGADGVTRPRWEAMWVDGLAEVSDRVAEVNQTGAVALEARDATLQAKQSVDQTAATIATQVGVATDAAQTATDKAGQASVAAGTATDRATVATQAAATATGARDTTVQARNDALEFRDATQAASDAAVHAATTATDAALDAGNSATVARAYVAAANFVLAQSSTVFFAAPGVKAVTVQAGLAFAIGQDLKAVSQTAPTTVWVYGSVTSYNAATGALVLTVPDRLGLYAGTGPASDWNIFTSPPPGDRGQSGDQGARGDDGQDGEVTAAQARKLAMIWG